MFVSHALKSSSDIIDEKRLKPLDVIELHLFRSSLVSRLKEIEIARSPSSLILVLITFKSSSDVIDERHVNRSAVIDSQYLKSSLVSRVKEVEIA